MSAMGREACLAALDSDSPWVARRGNGGTGAAWGQDRLARGVASSSLEKLTECWHCARDSSGMGLGEAWASMHNGRGGLLALERGRAPLVPERLDLLL